MSWSIHHVNLQAKDVRATAAFYSNVLGMTEAPWAFPPTRGYLPGDPDKLALMADARLSGLRIEGWIRRRGRRPECLRPCPGVHSGQQGGWEYCGGSLLLS